MYLGTSCDDGNGAGKPEKAPDDSPPTVTFGFTDLEWTWRAFGGASVQAQTAQQFRLFELLDGAVPVNIRKCGATDVETL